MEMERKHWGIIKGTMVDIFTIKDPKTGFIVEVSDYGATLVNVKVPDNEGNVEDVTISQNHPEDFQKYGAYLGAVVGRVANRIKNGKFTLDGQDYSLFLNNAGVNSLHGGEEGFCYKVWKFVRSSVKEQEAQIEFEYLSPDGEENYPGSLLLRAIYNISPMKLGWEFIATTDKTTILNITNHAYWNLEGLESLNNDHIVTLMCDKYMPADENDMVTGEVSSVEGTALDLRKECKISDIYATHGDIDTNFFITAYNPESPKKFNVCAEVYSATKGRKMIVETTEPCVHMYTGNYMGNLISRGKECRKHMAICFETQRPPNAINLPEFAPMVILKPGEVYTHKTQHTFSVE